MTHLLTTALSGVWPFAITNVDDFVLLTSLFLTVGRGGPGNLQIVVGQYVGVGILVGVSLLAAVGLSSVSARWVGLFGLVPIALGIRGLLQVHRTAEGDAVPPAVRGVAGVVALTLADGADNVGVYVPLFRQAGADATVTYVLVFVLLVGVWCAVARALADRRPLVDLIDRVGHWLVPVLYIVIGIRIILVAGLLGS